MVGKILATNFGSGLLNYWVLLFKMWFYFLMLFTVNVIFLCEMGPIQLIYNQHGAYWWLGALTPQHQQPQCWTCIHAFPFINGLSLQWHYNDHDGISNHRHLDCLLKCVFWHRSKKTSKLHVTGPLCGEFTGNFPAQRASNAENVSIWWRHYDTSQWVTKCLLTSFRDCVTLIINIFPSS